MGEKNVVLGNIKGMLSKMQKQIWSDLVKFGKDVEVAETLREYYEELNSIKEWINERQNEKIT